MPRCKKSSSVTPTANRALAGLMLALLGGAACPATAGDTAVADDSREIYNSSSRAPAWLQAVGKLRVPGSQYRDGQRTHLLEDCSATLVTRSVGRKADTLITAWHCLAYYDDLSKPITFTLPGDVGGEIPREAYRLADGGGMYADWAILRLRQPVAAAEAGALLIHPGRADPQQTISMAGYSRDAGKGDHGNRLTYDPACRITTDNPRSSSSDCLAHRGASGGAVVQSSALGTPLFSGVVSEGDGAGLSTYVPVAVFRGALGRLLD